MEEIHDCHVCGKERHLYVNKEKGPGLWYCHRCGASGNLGNLDSRTLPPRNDKRKRKNIQGDGQSAPETYPLSERSYRWLVRTRTLRKSIVNSARIFDTETGILFKFNGSDYWQVRQWSQFWPPRWLNPKGPKKDLYMVEQIFSPTVFVVEGIIDALAVGEFGPAAAILSSKIKECQAMKLAKKYDSAVLMLDGTSDVTEEIVNHNRRILVPLFEGRVWVERLTGGQDPASLDKKELKERVLHYGW